MNPTILAPQPTLCLNIASPAGLDSDQIVSHDTKNLTDRTLTHLPPLPETSLVLYVEKEVTLRLIVLTGSGALHVVAMDIPPSCVKIHEMRPESLDSLDLQ